MAKKKILAIKEVELDQIDRKSPILVIRAVGTVPTSGWKNPELVPFVYIQPPPDGVFDFDFVAESPEGIVAPAITPIVVNHKLGKVGDEFRGVRVHSSTNAEVALFGQKPVGGRTLCVKGELTDEGVECQTLRTKEDQLYTLVGNLNGFKVGDEVFVSGTVAEFSFCQQGTSISVDWISKDAPKLAASGER